MTQTTMQQRLDKAAAVLAALKATGKFRGARVWTGGSEVRVYTGWRDEYLTIAEDLSVVRSRLNMTWGQVIPANL